MSSNFIKLGQVATFINGKAFKPDEWAQSGIPIIRIQNLTNNTKEFNYYQGKLEPRYVVTKGDVLISWSASLGVFEWNGVDAALNQHIFKVQFNKLDVDKTYFRFIVSQVINEMIKFVHGSTMKHIVKSDFDNTKIPLPPLHEQQRIATILDQADSIRRKNRQILEKYNELAQSVFQEMFGDVIKNPKDWVKRPLGELVKIRRGASPRPISDFLGGIVPWIKISDGTSGSDIYIEKTKEAVTEDGAKRSVVLHPGTLIFANCGVSLGFARILKIKGCIHDGWLCFENIDDSILNKIFLLKLLNSISDYFRKSAPEGTQPNLNTSIMKGFEIPVPPISLQNRFSEIITDIVKQKELTQQSLEKSEDLFQSILQRAFKGKL